MCSNSSSVVVVDGKGRHDGKDKPGKVSRRTLTVHAIITSARGSDHVDSERTAVKTKDPGGSQVYTAEVE